MPQSRTTQRKSRASGVVLRSLLLIVFASGGYAAFANGPLDSGATRGILPLVLAALIAAWFMLRRSLAEGGGIAVLRSKPRGCAQRVSLWESSID